MINSLDEEINFDLERMKKAIEGPYRTMPSGLTREEFLEWMLRDSKERNAMNCRKEKSKAIAKRGRDAIVSAYKEEAE